jgi:KDO2-lipid IV(A) lauroyltransferase
MSSELESDFRWHRWAPFQFLLYLMLRVIIMVIDMFPCEMAPEIGRRLGSLIRFVDRKHARIAVKNLEKSRGVCRPDEIPGFIDRVYGHIGLGIVEMLMIPRLMKRHQISRYARLERFDVIDHLFQAGRGVIVTVGHLGNWELIGLAVTLAGYRLNSLARPIDNPWADRYLNRFRTQTGQEIIPRDRAMGSMVSVLQRNEMLAIQIDQDARHAGVLVDFFGRHASTHRSPAILSLKYGAPIVPLNIYREGGLHCCVAGEPLFPDDYRGRPDAVKALTQACTDQFEKFVRAHPAQWFWIHDRWKSAERAARVTPEALEQGQLARLPRK